MSNSETGVTTYDSVQFTMPGNSNNLLLQVTGVYTFTNLLGIKYLTGPQPNNIICAGISDRPNYNPELIPATVSFTSSSSSDNNTYQLLFSNTIANTFNIA